MKLLIETNEKSLWKIVYLTKVPLNRKSTISPKDKISTPLATQSAQKTGRKIARPRFFLYSHFSNRLHENDRLILHSLSWGAFAIWQQDNVEDPRGLII